MDIGLLSILHNKKWDFRPDMAQATASMLKNAIELQIDNNLEKKHGYFLSKKGYQKEGRTVGANFEDKLYVGNIHRIESHLYWNDEELADDDQIINVVVVDGPLTRDGGGCSYGTKDFRDQVLYANTIPQVVGHIFVINTAGGEAACRNDYEMMIDDCRKNGKPTVAFVDGMCCSSGVGLASRCDRVVVMNPKDEFGCIGTMAAFWAVAHDTVDQDGERYVELVGKDCPEKNAWWREAAKGEYEKLQAEIDRDTEEFHQTVRENRPLVTDDMLSGKVFDSKDVIPALVDEIGDYNRAIECVFLLAEQKMQAARFTVKEPAEEPGEKQGGDPEDMAKLNAQQKAAIATSRGSLMMVDDGHVTTDVQGFFGPETVEVAKPQNENNMTDEEKKAQEAAAAQAAQEQEAAGQEGQEAGGAAGEGAAEGADEGAGEGSGNDAGEGAGNGEGSGEGEGNGEGSGEGAGNGEGSGEGAGDQPSDEALQNAQADIDKMTETLHNAEQMIADRDKQIAQLKESLATLNGIAEERDAAVKERNDISASLEKAGLDYAEQGKRLTGAEAKIAEHVATIETLRKQVADLRAEVKELAEKPGDMTDGTSGIPAGNGIGAPPKDMGTVSSTVSPDMTPEQIRAALRKQDEDIKARRNRR